MPTPVASGGNDRRVGLAPTGKAPPCHSARGIRTLLSCSRNSSSCQSCKNEGVLTTFVTGVLPIDRPFSGRLLRCWGSNRSQPFAYSKTPEFSKTSQEFSCMRRRSTGGEPMTPVPIRQNNSDSKLGVLQFACLRGGEKPIVVQRFVFARQMSKSSKLLSNRQNDISRALPARSLRGRSASLRTFPDSAQ